MYKVFVMCNIISVTKESAIVLNHDLHQENFLKASNCGIALIL